MTATIMANGATTLAGFLRDRRARVRPEPGQPGRRRTPGLRREEVAGRAGVSVTWYTWLEQGRGGPPSDEVVERLARALELDATAREVLFLLARRRMPPVLARPVAPMPTALQAVLDQLGTSPAIVKTTTWDVVGWNEAATVVLADYPALLPHERNGLRRMFCDPEVRHALPDWDAVARFAVGVFRVDVTRAPEGSAAHALAAELRDASADFRRLWAENDVRSFGTGQKRLMHPTAGMLAFDYLHFAIDGADGLSMIVYSPTGDDEKEAVARLMAGRRTAMSAMGG